MRPLIVELSEWVDGVYGTYMDALVGFSLHHKKFVDGQKEHTAAVAKRREIDPTVQFGGASFGYGRLVKAGHTGESMHHHHVPYGEALARNAYRGRNSQYMGRMAIVSFFGFWNDHTRPRLEEEMQYEKNSLKVPVFGDLRHFRDLIIHNQARADERVRRLEVLRWVKEGDIVSPDRTQIEETVDHIFRFINEFEASPERFRKNKSESV